MSIASRITAIEEHIGDVYDTIDYSYDTTGVDKNIINIPKYLKKGYIDILNNGTDTLYSNFPKVSGKGSNLSLTPTYEAPMRNLPYGDTLQDGTPTPDTPVEIQSVTGLQNVEVCGKNLCFNITKPSNANLKFFINKSISKTFTISFTTNEALNGNSLYLEVDGTSYGNIGGITGSANTKVEKTYTLSDTNYQAIKNGTNIDLLLYKNGANFNIPDDGMVENNSTATEYEPYNSNTYEVNLGKNLFDVSATPSSIWRTTVVSGSNLSLKPTQSGGSGYVSYDIPVSSSTTYTASVEEIITENFDTFNGQFYLYEYNSSNTQSFIANISKSNLSRTFTTKADTVKIRLQPYSYTGDISNWENITVTYKNIQLEKGTQATSYSPYFTPIELNKIGDYEDRIYKDNGKWYVEKQIGKVVLDGSEICSLVSNNTNTTRYLITAPFSTIINDTQTILYCDYLPAYPTDERTQDKVGITSYVNNIYIRLSASNYTTLSDFTTWLSTYKPKVLYPLATPEITEITNTELINQLEALYTAKSKEGITNISSTSENLPMIISASALKDE